MKYMCVCGARSAVSPVNSESAALYPYSVNPYE